MRLTAQERRAVFAFHALFPFVRSWDRFSVRIRKELFNCLTDAAREMEYGGVEIVIVIARRSRLARAWTCGVCPLVQICKKRAVITYWPGERGLADGLRDLAFALLVLGKRLGAILLRVSMSGEVSDARRAYLT